MSKLLVPLIVVLILVGGGFYFYQNFKAKPIYQPTPSPKITTTSTPPIQGSISSPAIKSDTCEVLTKGSADIPPLYKEGITWQQPTISEYEVPLKTEERKLQGCIIKSNKISVKEKIDIRGYYYGRLLNLGWNNIVSADGPTGGVESYQKENKYLVVSVNYDINVENPQFFTTEVFYRE